jgi:small-conductance mechanosensitive channel
MSNAQDVLQRIDAGLAWVPPWAVGVVLLAFAVLVALFLHRLLMLLVTRTLARRHPFLAHLVRRAQGPARLALAIFAVRLAVPLAPFEPATVFVLGRVLSVSIIVLLGWIALVAVEIAAGLHLRRFRIDVEDNLMARKHVTQVRLLRRAVDTLVVIVTIAAALMIFDSVRQYGVSLFASAGAAGLVLGLAARPVLSNLIAGVQLALTQPIRIDDAVIVENEWGWIEEITSTYVVVRLWDWRRLVVPLAHFIEKPFQNWTRENASLIGSVMLYVDYRAPVESIRRKLEEFAKQSKLWDGKVVNLQVTDARERTIELRALVSARNAPQAWDLRCEIREKLIRFLRESHPDALPRARAEVALSEHRSESEEAAPRAA